MQKCQKLSTYKEIKKKTWIKNTSKLRANLSQSSLREMLFLKSPDSLGSLGVFCRQLEARYNNTVKFAVHLKTRSSYKSSIYWTIKKGKRFME